MEGVTDRVYRAAHRRIFGGADRYGLPFWSPGAEHRLTPRAARELDPAENAGVPVLPQVMTRSAEDFRWASQVLADLGYDEVNLNVGCPSGTVTAKGKGAALLGNPDGLARLLDGIFTDPPLPVSVKTRLGVRDPGEFPALLAVYNRYPLRSLTVHARVLEDQYRRPARPAWFAGALAGSRCPVCLNGDLKTAADCTAAAARYPQAAALMVGRGLLADPALLRRARGGPPAGREELRAFTEALTAGYTAAFGGPHNAMLRMKGHWRYLILLFEDGGKAAKALRRAGDARQFADLTRRVLEELPLRETPAVDW